MTAITCSPDRSPEAIAKDITRRLLPQATALYARALAYIEEQRQAADKRRAVATRITAKFQYREGGRDGDLTLYGTGNMPTLEVNYYGHVRFKSLDVPEDVAMRVLAVLRDAGLGLS